MNITLSKNPQRVTITAADTSEGKINFDAMLIGAKTPVSGVAIIKRISGTAVQFDANGAAITADSDTLESANDKLVLPIIRGVNISMKGSVGGEVFSITIVKD